MSVSTVLSGKVALVTGASRGIGASIATHLAAQGATVLVNYSRSEGPAKELVAKIEAAGGKAKLLKGDVSDNAHVEALFKAIDTEHGGRIDILVNNAGVYVTGSFPEFSEADFDKNFDVNVKGVFMVVKHALARIPDGGRIINIGSCLGEAVPFPGVTVYSASKFAVAGLTRGWARDFAPRKITVNVVQPGPIDTDMNPADEAKNPAAGYIKNLIPLGRYGQPDDIGATVAFLASPAAGFITGTTINVDGGLLA